MTRSPSKASSAISTGSLAAKPVRVSGLRGSATDPAPSATVSGANKKKSASGTTSHKGSQRLKIALLSDHVGYMLRRAQLVVFDDAMKALSETGLRLAQFSAMSLMRENPGRKQAEIARALGIQRPNMVALLNGLEARGLAVRVRSQIDRRSHAMMLTPEGDALLDRAIELLNIHEKRMTQRIGEEHRAMFMKILGNISHPPVKDEG